MPNPRVRFAPSPTGYLHVGGARTALFNWLFARQNKGQFILRIEDTDQERSESAMIDQILASLLWLGLEWDEGPFFQSQRLTDYHEAVSHLLANGRAYRCFCPPRDPNSPNWQYDRACRQLNEAESQRRANQGERFVVRLKTPDGETTFTDLIQGTITVRHDTLDDFIIRRSDGTPVYHLACVVDDAAMGISHVIRGADHLSNTPKQILLYQALGFGLPTFAHVPLIFGPDKKRLSKRHGATAVDEYRRQGFLPATMINFLALLGWSSGTDRELFTLEELLANFALDRVARQNAVFDPQKLLWMNGQYLNQLDLTQFYPLFIAELQKAKLVDDRAINQYPDWLSALALLIQPRLKLLNETAELTSYFFSDNFEYEPAAIQKHWRDGALGNLQAVFSTLQSQATWDVSNLEAVIRSEAERLGVSASKLIHPLRLALTGRAVSPGLFEVMVLLGRDRVLSRLQKAIKWLSR